MNSIVINYISLDPKKQKKEIRLAGLEQPDSSTSNFILIQTAQPLNRAQRDELKSLGVNIQEYVEENAYICHYPPDDLGAIRGLPYIEWANIYLKDFKIPPQLRDSNSGTQTTNLLSLKPVETSMSQQPVELCIIPHKNVAIADIRDKIATAARLDPGDIDINGTSVRITILPQHIEDLGEIDEIRHIEEYSPPKLLNNVARGIIQADLAQSGVQLQGKGQVVAVCDTGFDKGSTSKVHPAFSKRVKKLYPLGRAGKANDPDGHGTHVAGSVLGDGKSSTMGNPIQGTAPKAELVLQSVLDGNGGLGGIPNDLNDLFKGPYNDEGARIHTNSWGTVSRFYPERFYGKYTSYSEQVDQFVWKHRDFVVCFAAGNEGSDKNGNGTTDNGSINPPGTAKNCITVGATESNRPGESQKYGLWKNDFPAAPIASDLWADNPDGMAAFSSRGPTKNERIKPDIVAPGTSILSACSRDAKVGSFWGKSSDSLYAFMGGTSMATPLVAGCTAVVREYFLTQENHQPSAALVKAMLINGARDISGQYIPSEAPAIPNTSEGFGRVDLAATVGPRDSNERLTFKDEKTELDTGDVEQTDEYINTSDSLLKATLVWTDPPGEALQNDLDLIVRTADGQERHGNMPAGSTDFDRKNNVEQVTWHDIPKGKVEIVVKAHRVTLHPQSYALVVRVS